MILETEPKAFQLRYLASLILLCYYGLNSGHCVCEAGAVQLS